MTIYVVLEASGGWSGTDVYHGCSVAFRTEEAAKAYVSEHEAKHDMWTGTVWEVWLDDAHPTL